MFSQSGPDVIAVLDWELSTLGDPISDLAYSCLQYHLPQNFPVVPGTSFQIEPTSLVL